MDLLIQGINVGAGISRFSQAIVERYGLTAYGYRFPPGSEPACFGRFERAVADDAKPQLGEATLAELSALDLGNARVSALDDALRNSGTRTTEPSGDRT